jgi:hypothetical protein
MSREVEPLPLPKPRPPSWVDERERYETIARAVEPAVVLSTKDAWGWTAAWVGLLVLVTLVSLGVGTHFFLKKMSRSTFLGRYATTLGPLQGYPRGFERLSRSLLVHEARHTTQAVGFGYAVPVLGWLPFRRFRAVVGLLPMGLVYGLLPVPILVCYGRYRLELDADRASYRWMLRHGYSISEVRERSRRFADRVASGAYLWCWPAPLVRRGFRRVLDREIATYVSEIKK